MSASTGAPPLAGLAGARDVLPRERDARADGGAAGGARPGRAVDLQSYRIGDGRVDRSRTLSFAFDGRRLEGHPGDTLASALLANGQRLVGRSFKYHRPRGIVSAGVEEPNALVGVGRGARHEPNVRATVAELHQGLVATSQNRRGTLRHDLMAVNDLAAPLLAAGFYYKTFMWPKAFWEKVYEPAIRASAGLGRLSGQPDPDAYGHGFLFADVLVIGAGPAGLAAALAAGRAGARTILCDEDFLPGGRLNAETHAVDGTVGHAWAAETRSPSVARAGQRARHDPHERVRRLRPRHLRGAGARDRPPAARSLGRRRQAGPVARARDAHGARRRRHRAPRRVPGQRPARDHARGRRARLPQPLRRRAGPSRVGVHDGRRRLAHRDRPRRGRRRGRRRRRRARRAAPRRRGRAARRAARARRRRRRHARPARAPEHPARLGRRDPDRSPRRVRRLEPERAPVLPPAGPSRVARRHRSLRAGRDAARRHGRRGGGERRAVPRCRARVGSPRRRARARSRSDRAGGSPRPTPATRRWPTTSRRASRRTGRCR